MIRRLSSTLAVLALALLPTLASADMIRLHHPGVAPVGGSYVTNCVPYASSTSTLLCTPATSDGVNLTLASGRFLLPNGTAAAPSLGFTNASLGAGMYWQDTNIGAGSEILVITHAGAAQLAFGSNQLRLKSNAALGWSSGDPSSATGDLLLYRNAANTLALRNGTSAQAFNIYNTYTDGSNYERLNVGTSASTAFVYASSAGTGTARPLDLGANGSVQWRITTDGHLIGLTDNAFDIGAAGATRPRNIYAGGTGVFGAQVTAGTNVQIASTGYFQTATRATFTSPEDGMWALTNAATTQKVRLKFSGAPSVAGSCGTSPSVAGQDTAMVVTTGTGSPTSCAVTFQSTWTTAPVCTANAQTTTTPINVVTTATTVTVSSAALTASEKLYILCVGY